MFVQLTNMEQWRVLKRHSVESPILLLKYSLGSPVSAAILQQLRESSAAGQFHQLIHLVVVQENKEIAEAIDRDLNTDSAVPQVIIMKNTQCIGSSTSEHLGSILPLMQPL